MVCCSQVTIGYFACCTCTLVSLSLFCLYFPVVFSCFLLSSNLLSRGSPPRTPCRCLMLKTKTLNNESIYVNISFSGLLLSGDNWIFLIVVRAQCAVVSLV